MSSEATPTALKLPDELWLDILGKRGLDYFDLKRSMRVCKKLNRLVKDSSFDRKLFRKSPTPGKKLAKKSKIRLHPILEDLDFTGVSANACFAQDDYDEECNYWDHPIVLEEFATSPTATAIQLDFKVEFIVVRNEKGVTLRQLLEEVADMWKSSYWLLGDHNGWTGWDYEWVSKSGTLCFEAGSYDS